jgi:hypothetical protein
MKRFAIFALTLGTLFSFAFVASPAFAGDAAAKKAACEAIGGTSNAAGDCSTGATNATPQDIFSQVIQIFSWVVGAISVIMLIFGGFKYITSGGDAGKITGAKNTILYAIVGLVIVALSQVIINFVLDRAINASKKPPAAMMQVARYS